MSSKVKLSVLVRDYLARGRPEYAITLVLAANRPITISELRKIATMFDRELKGFMSWIRYSITRGLFKNKHVE